MRGLIASGCERLCASVRLLHANMMAYDARPSYPCFTKHVALGSNTMLRTGAIRQTPWKLPQLRRLRQQQRQNTPHALPGIRGCK
jgi:hypothetical protein